jgi:transcriptional regulator of acetoin/glycerol metabolism
LVRFFLDQSSKERKYSISKQGMKNLLSYSWPGNVRELKNVLEREIILAEGTELSLRSLGPEMLAGRGLPGPKATLKEAERAHILRVLRSVKWNKKAAAEILGIGRPTIYDKMKHYGIQEGE